MGIVGFCGASFYGWSKGDPAKLFIGWDSDGNGCGYSEATKDYPYLYFAEAPGDKVLEAIKTFDVSVVLDLLRNGVCVKSCPTASKDSKIECKITKAMANDSDFVGCYYQIDEAFFTTWDIDIAEYEKEFTQTPGTNTWPYRYDTKKFYGFCRPLFNTDNAAALSEKTIQTFKKTFQDTIQDDKITAWVADIAFSWAVILIGSLTAILFGYLYLIIIKCIGGIIIWFTIAALLLFILLSGVYVYGQASKYEEGTDYHDWMKYAAYTIWGIGALYAICICCCWRAIRIGIAVYRTTAEYVSKNLRIYLLPLLTYLVAGCWLAVWLVSAIYVFSVGEPTRREAPYDFITEVKWEQNTRYVIFYQVFMLFWINAFIMGMC